MLNSPFHCNSCWLNHSFGESPSSGLDDDRPGSAASLCSPWSFCSLGMAEPWTDLARNSRGRRYDNKWPFVVDLPIKKCDFPYTSVFGWWFGTWLLWLSHHIGNVIIPTDEVHHFSEGWAQPPTRLYEDMVGRIFGWSNVGIVIYIYMLLPSSNGNLTTKNAAIMAIQWEYHGIIWIIKRSHCDLTGMMGIGRETRAT